MTTTGMGDTPVGQRPARVTTVSSCADAGPGTLRQAMLDAVSGDSIDLSGLACATITLTSGAVIGYVENLRLVGPPTGLTVRGSASDPDRVIVHNGGGTLELIHLHIANGAYTGEYGGGCIYAYGNVYLGASTVSGCTLTGIAGTPANGGGIYARGIVQLNLSSVTGNLATAPSGSAAGGGIWSRALNLGDSLVGDNVVASPENQTALGGGAYATGDVLIDRSTLTANSAKSGGALFLTGSEANFAALLENSTVSGNQTGSAGAVFVAAGIDLISCTIAFNGGPEQTSVPIGFSRSKGLVARGENPVIRSSIIAGNLASTGNGSVAQDVGGDSDLAVEGADNLIGVSGLALPAGTLRGDPQLGPLQDNGGPTPTHALLAGSPAIDHGSNVFAYDYDQRGPGYLRTVGANADIGAFEFGARPDLIFKDGFQAL